MEDRLVRSLTINFGLMLLASTTLLVGAITYITGILVALESS